MTAPSYTDRSGLPTSRANCRVCFPPRYNALRVNSHEALMSNNSEIYPRLFFCKYSRCTLIE